jgi:hypothetical protein
VHFRKLSDVIEVSAIGDSAMLEAVAGAFD